MLQLLGRSTIKYDSRPVLMLFAPGLWTPSSPTHLKPLAKARPSILLKKSGLSESTSSNGPCLSHALRIRMRPASSNICASMIPGLSLKSAIVAWPLTTASAASLLQPGHSDSVFLGTPAAICFLSQLLSSGLGAQVGRGDCPLGKIALTLLANDHAAFDAVRKTRAGWADIGQNLLWGFV